MANGEHVHGELRLRCGLRVEEFDGEVVVLDPDGNAVHRVEGDGVAAVRLLQSGVARSDVPQELVDAVAARVEAGLVDDGRRVSRRAALATGGGVALTAATVTTFALADPAAALSMCANGYVTDVGMAYGPGPDIVWFTTGPGGSMSTVDVIFRAWGGGGGGGQSDAGSSLGGGGGGGGGYAYTVEALPECSRTRFIVHVGSGGMGGNGGSATAGGGSLVDVGDGTLIVVANGGSFGDAGTGGMWGAGGGGSFRGHRDHFDSGWKWGGWRLRGRRWWRVRWSRRSRRRGRPRWEQPKRRCGRPGFPGGSGGRYRRPVPQRRWRPRQSARVRRGRSRRRQQRN